MRQSRTKGKKMPRKYDERHRMPNKLIEELAYGVTSQYLQKYPYRAHSVPVSPEKIMDCLWDFYVETEDLQSEYGTGTHGALFIYDGERRVAIDKSIDPKVNPRMLGRYNFSVAHEAGHWVIHAPDMLADENAPLLLGEKGKPTILCRSSNRDERERQADRFAGYLLMPRDLVYEAWRAKYGDNSKAPNVFEELQELRERFHLPPDSRKVFCQIAHDFAATFAVSPEAMQIRLSELGLIKLEEDNQMDLF